jgi:hypothetical protein
MVSGVGGYGSSITKVWFIPFDTPTLFGLCCQLSHVNDDYDDDGGHGDHDDRD